MTEQNLETPAPDVTPEPEPEGLVEVHGHGKVVPLAALTAERERIRTATEAKIRAEYEPVKAKADQADKLAADLEAIRPHIEYLQKHPELTARQEPAVPEVSDEKAEKFARDYELFTPTGLDLARAKRIIANQEKETKAAALAAAHEAVAPMARMSAAQQAQQNYIWAAQQVGPDGQPLVDAQDLAAVFREFPPELAANPDVAKVILEAAIGRTVRSGKHVTRPGQEPTFTEPAGGGREGYRPSDLERKVARAAGLTDKQWTEHAKGFQPDASNVLGD